MVLHLSKNYESVPTCTIEEDEVDDVKDCTILGISYAMIPILPRVSGTSRCTSSLFPTTVTTVSFSIKVTLLQGEMAGLSHKLFLDIKLTPSLWLSSGTPDSVWRLGQTQGRIGSARDQLIWPYKQASLVGTESLILWRKGDCEAQTSWCSLEAEVKR